MNITDADRTWADAGAGTLRRGPGGGLAGWGLPCDAMAEGERVILKSLGFHSRCNKTIHGCKSGFRFTCVLLHTCTKAWQTRASPAGRRLARAWLARAWLALGRGGSLGAFICFYLILYMYKYLVIPMDCRQHFTLHPAPMKTHTTSSALQTLTASRMRHGLRGERDFPDPDVRTGFFLLEEVGRAQPVALRTGRLGAFSYGGWARRAVAQRGRLGAFCACGVSAHARQRHAVKVCGGVPAAAVARAGRRRVTCGALPRCGPSWGFV